MDVPPLESFGRRIMICGPSNSGKSTLAVAIGRKLGVDAIHVDRFRHLPNTDWVPRPDGEFAQLHDAAITADAWVMDGNYSKLIPQRRARATGIVLLSNNRAANFGRYLRRTLFERDRAGALDGAHDSIKWEMIHWILVASPRNVARYRTDLPKPGAPFIEVRGMGELKQLYRMWNLTRG